MCQARDRHSSLGRGLTAQMCVRLKPGVRGGGLARLWELRADLPPLGAPQVGAGMKAGGGGLNKGQRWERGV